MLSALSVAREEAHVSLPSRLFRRGRPEVKSREYYRFFWLYITALIALVVAGSVAAWLL
jgi:hypothetical protein